MKVILIFFVAHWYLSLFFQTFFLHRYAAHGAFGMSKFTEKVFFVLTWIFQGSNYLSAYGYGVMHRMHHAFADTPDDPHSPKYDETIWKMMWKTKTIYAAITNKEMQVEERFTKGVPEWTAFDNFARSTASRVAWGAIYVLIYWQFATVWWLWLLLPIQFLMSPIHGAIINWFAHKYGYRNFKVADTSRNFLPVDFLMMGESYHNNHHKNGSRANFGGIRWHELDPTYMVILLFDKVGIIKLKKKRRLSNGVGKTSRLNVPSIYIHLKSSRLSYRELFSFYSEGYKGVQDFFFGKGSKITSWKMPKIGPLDFFVLTRTQNRGQLLNRKTYSALGGFNFFIVF